MKVFCIRTFHTSLWRLFSSACPLDILRQICSFVEQFEPLKQRKIIQFIMNKLAFSNTVEILHQLAQLFVKFVHLFGFVFLNDIFKSVKMISLDLNKQEEVVWFLRRPYRKCNFIISLSEPIKILMVLQLYKIESSKNATSPLIWI